MGGTSTDISLISGGASALASGREVGAMRIALPSLDIVTLGAGGGSIAARGAGGLLRVGPESAGANPGPACYGSGGTAPTVTDANLMLGFLQGGESLSGRTLDPAAAEAALRRVGETLGLEPVALAAGIWRLVNARMADAVRVATVRRGVDPRRFTLLSFGGAAGLHVAAVAAELGIGRVVVPAEASVLSAWGMLHTDLRVQSARSFAGSEQPELQTAFVAMERDGRARLAWFEGQLEVSRSADIRYGEQVFEIPVSLDGIDLAASNARARIDERFARAHEALFTYSLPGEEVAIVNARLAVTGRLPPAPDPAPRGAGVPAAPRSRRPIHLGGWIEAPLYRLEAMADGQAVSGPALIESATTTVLLREHDAARLDGRGWLVLDVSA
jgi:N-methylhydantoinase A